MKVLLLGANGMLGHDLAQTFADTDLTAFDQADLDITDAGAVAAKVADLKPDFIINAAAYTAVDDAETNRDVAFAVNADGIKNVAAAAQAAGAKLVHYSTDYVFPGDNPDGYTEDSKPGPPVNIYGESKLAGEQALADSGARYYLLRTAWLYGHHGKNFVDTMLKLATEREELSVVNDQHGSPTYTKDLAQATRTILDGDYPPGIYHTVNSGITTWFEFAKKIFELASKDIKVSPVTSAEFPRPAKRPAYSILKNNRGPALRPWEEALADYLNQ